MADNTKNNDNASCISSACRKGAFLVALFYLAALPLRPLYAPWEYEFSAQLHGLIPLYPDAAVLLRLPAALATLASAALIICCARQMRLETPGMAAIIYLLLPPVFYLGTSASAAPVFAFGCIAGACGLYIMSRTRQTLKRLLGIFLSLPGVLLAIMVAKTPLYESRFFLLLLLPVLALVLTGFIEYLGRTRKEQFKNFLDRFSFVTSGVLISMAVLVLLPAILHHFKIDFPEKAAIYQSGERVFRPVLVFLVPILWLHLVRHSSKLKEKLTFWAVTLAFFMFMLPHILPWRTLRDLNPQPFFSRLSAEVVTDKTRFFADRECAALVAGIFKKPVTVVGDAPGEVKISELEKSVDDVLKNAPAVIVWSDRSLSKSSPKRTGMRRYVMGRYTLCRYISGSEK